MTRKIKFLIIVVFMLFGGVAQAQIGGGGGKNKIEMKKSKLTKGKENKLKKSKKKQSKKDYKLAKKRHIGIQDKRTQKKMKKNRKSLDRNRSGRFLEKLFRRRSSTNR